MLNRVRTQSGISTAFIIAVLSFSELSITFTAAQAESSVVDRSNWGPILQSNNEHMGPGHHAFLQNPTTGQWYIVYHRWNHAVDKGKMPPNRSVSIDNLNYDKNGDIIPIKMTDTGIDTSEVLPQTQAPPAKDPALSL